MSQTESNNPLGSMISQLLSNPQQMQQLQQMAASLGLTAPNDNGAASACPQNESSNGTTPVSPNLSSLLGALSSPPPSQNTPALPALDSRMVGTIQKVILKLIFCAPCVPCFPNNEQKKLMTPFASCSWFRLFLS